MKRHIINSRLARWITLLLGVMLLALELGWTLEDNESIKFLVEEAGARINKKYCIFRKSL